MKSNNPTNKIKLYKPELKDLWFRELILKDPDTMSYNHAYGGTIIFDKSKWNDWYNRWVLNSNNTKYYRYIKDMNDNFVGEVSYHKDETSGRCMLSIIIYSKYRKRGYGRESLNLIFNILKENGIDVVYDDLAKDNPALNLFIKCGFVEEMRDENVILLKKVL